MDKPETQQEVSPKSVVSGTNQCKRPLCAGDSCLIITDVGADPTLNRQRFCFQVALLHFGKPRSQRSQHADESPGFIKSTHQGQSPSIESQYRRICLQELGRYCGGPCDKARGFIGRNYRSMRDRIENARNVLWCARSKKMHDCIVDAPLALVPATGAKMQQGDLVDRPMLEARAEKFREHHVISIPTTFGIQRDEKWVACLQVSEDVLAVISTEHLIAKRC